MSRATAEAEAKKLKAILERHGVKVSIELQIGRPWSGDEWYSAKHVLMNHHTAGSKTGNTPSLALVKKGRGKDLPGPLCNGYGGRDLVFRIITMGLANHPGEGGPLTLAGFTIPKDSARISTFGIEWEHDGVSDWPPEMLEFMGRVGAGVLEYLGAPAERSCEHSTWAPKRKIDRNDFTAKTGQTLIKKWAGDGPRKEDDMPTPEQLWEADLIPVTKTATAKTNPTYSAKNALGRVVDRMEQIYPLLVGMKAAMDAQSVALKALAANKPEDIRKALADFETGLAQKLADIDVHVTLGDKDANG
jgi:hypothetical protein